MTVLCMQRSSSSRCDSTCVASDEITDRIRVMQRQEETTYCCGDYLSKLTASDTDERKGPNKSGSTIKPDTHVNEDCRVKMTAWCYRVVDYCKYKREIVDIAMSYLDRFLQSDYGTDAFFSRKTYQLVTISALYLAIKMYESEIMEPQLLSDLSRGFYSVEDITDMEIQLLVALRWRVSPPTMLSFVHHLLALIPQGAMNGSTRRSIYDCAKFQTELAVGCCSLVSIMPSVVAFASIINALESIEDACLSQYVRSSFMSEASELIGMTNVPKAQKELALAFSKNSGVHLSAAARVPAASCRSHVSEYEVKVNILSGHSSPRSITEQSRSLTHSTA